MVYLQGQQKQKSLDTVVTAINEVTKKQVICVRALSTDLEQFDQVVKLTVNVTTDLHTQ